MSLLNKTFKDNITGQTVKVSDINEGIVTLNNGEKVVTSRMMDSSYYEEVVDPASFFSQESNSLMGSIMDKVKNIKTDHMIDDNTITNSMSSVNDGFTPSTNESAVIQVSEEDEKEALMRKYNIQEPPKTTSVDELLGNNTTSTATFDNSGYTSQPNPVQQSQPQPVQQIQVEDPIISMFKNVKRNVDFKVDFTIDDKIPRIDFIEMMEDSYNTSIIEYLADEFTNKLLNDPSVIKNMIKEKIESLVKEGGEVKEVVKKPTRKPSTRKKTDTKPTRKPSTRTTAKKTTARKTPVKKTLPIKEEKPNSEE